MNRRAYLKLVASTGAATALAGCGERSEDDPTGTTPDTTADRTENAPETTQQPDDEDDENQEDVTDRFGTVVNMVEDAGCDPDGDEPCDRAFRDAAADDTLLLFPPGTYRFEETNRVFGLNNFGIFGDGDVTFEAPAGINGQWIVADRGRDLLFRNVTLDVTADNCAPTLKLGVQDGLDVRDVTVEGRGTRDDSAPRGEGGNPPVGSSFLPIVRSPDGEGVVERYVAETGGRIGTYNGGDGRAGVFIGQSHRGRIDLVDCHLEEFPNNGIYASRTTGAVNVEGGTFRNNDISQVRLGSRGKLYGNPTVEVDVTDVGGPSDPDDFLNPRGVRLEGGQVNRDGEVDPEGATVRDTTVRMLTAPSSPGIAVGNNGGAFTIESTTLTVVADGCPGIIAKTPDGGDHYQPPPEPHSGTIRDVRVIGGASSGRAIWLINREGTELENVDIDQPGTDRDGIYVERSPNCTLRGCAVLTGRYPILIRPDREDDADCTVRLDEMEYLGSVDNLSGSVRQQVPRLISNQTYCVDPSTADFDGVNDPVIAVTYLRSDDVLQEVISRNVVDG